MQFESDEFNYFIYFYFVLFLRTLVEYKLTHFSFQVVLQMNGYVYLQQLFLFLGIIFIYFFILHFIIYLFHYIKGSERNMRSIKREPKVCDLTRLLYIFRLEIMITLLLWTGLCFGMHNTIII